MRDYTTNNYCDFLWINDLLGLKKNTNNIFTKELPGKQKPIVITISNVIIFGTIVEVKPIGSKGYIYQIDDGTGVIACKHSEEQFEELIRSVESEQIDTLNETLESQQCLDQSVLTDASADDSVFNDRSLQVEEINAIKKGRLKGLRSIWDDLYASFNSLIGQYNIGDSVIIQGKLYNYFSVNQIYVNCIRPLSITEEIMQLTIKIEDDPNECQEAGCSKISSDPEKRLSGLVTFDNIQKLNPTFSLPARSITPELKEDTRNEAGVVSPHLETTITFDTFPNKM